MSRQRLTSRRTWPERTSLNFLIIALVITCLFYEVFLNPHQMMWGSDIVRIGVADKEVEWSSFWQWRSFPSWDPTTFGGRSRVGDQIPLFLHPLGIVFWLIRSPSLFGFVQWFCVVVAGWGMFLFARRKGCDAFGAFFASIAFAASGKTAAHLFAGHFGLVLEFIQLPWILLVADALIERKRLSSALLFGAVLALVATMGSMHVLYLHILFTTGYVVVSLFHVWRDQGHRAALRPLLYYAVGLLILLAASAAWWLPIVRQTLLLSARAQGGDYAFSTMGSAAPRDLVRFIWPFAGIPLPQPFVPDAAMKFSWESASYPGLVTLCLALSAIIVLRRRRGVLALGALALVALLLSLGRHSPLYWLAYHVIPGFGLFRSPGRILIYANFVVAILAGLLLSYGRNAKLRGFVPAILCVMLEVVLFAPLAMRGTPLDPVRGRWVPLLAIAILAPLAVFWAMNHVSDKLWRGTCLGVLLIELFLCWQPHMHVVEPREALPPFSAAQFLAEKREEEEFRILDTTRMIQQQIAARHDLEIVTGYHAGIYGHYLDFYKKIWHHDESDIVELLLHSPREIACPVILDLMNARYVISTESDLGAGYEEVYRTLPNELRHVRYVYRRRSALPRAFLVSRADVPPEGTSVLDALCSIDPRDICLVEDRPVIGSAEFQELPIDRRSPSDITLRFTTKEKGVAVISQTWHPDWRATDNGATVEVRRVNHAQVGIPVDAGEHELRIWYRPWDFSLGAVISGLTWAGMIVFLLISKPLSRAQLQETTAVPSEEEEATRAESRAPSRQRTSTTAAEGKKPVLSRLKVQYLKAHCRRHSDAKLAKALGVDKSIVREARKRHSFTRSNSDEQWIRNHPDAKLPEYTGQLPVPEKPVALSRSDYLTAAFVALAAMAVYLLTLGPTVTGEDAGELVTAAYTLGIAHPPGYPIWCLLGKLFTTILPFGTVAWRINFMSAFFATATVFMVCVLVIKLTRNRLAAIAAALAFAFSSEFWEQSVIAEVYTLNAFFIALCVLLLFLWHETRKNHLLLILAFVYGLSLCNHNTMILMGPVFLAYILYIDREPLRRRKLYVAMLVLFMLGLSVYIYMPIRSFADPPVDWGNPETLENFWDCITRKQYRFGLTENPRTVGRFLRQTWVFLSLYSKEFTPWLAWLPLIGAFALWKKDKLHFTLLLGIFCIIVFGFIFILNFKFDKQSLWLNNVFWIPAYMVAAMLMGLAIDLIGSLKWKRFSGSFVAIPLVFAAILCPLSANYYRNDKSEYYFAYDFGMNVLKTLEEGVVYMPSADHCTFPALYLQAVEGVRPDVVIGNKYGYPEESLYEDIPLEIRSRFRKIPTEVEQEIIEDWVITHSDRPVYFSKKRPLSKLPGRDMMNAGLLYRVVQEGEEVVLKDYWKEYTWHTLDEADTRGDLTAEFVLADYNFGRGREHLAKGDIDEGLKEFEKTLSIVGEGKETFNNLASSCAEHGQYDAAANYYTRALELDPDYEIALRNLGKLCMQMEKYDQALERVERLVEKLPKDYEANWIMARCLKSLGRVDDALAQLQKLAEIAPESDQVFREMGMIYLNEKRDIQTARRMFAKSLSLNANQPELAILMTQQPRRMEGPQMPSLLPPMPEPALPQLPEVPTLPGP